MSVSPEDCTSDEVLLRLRREFPLQVQLAQQQLIIEKLRGENARLRSELAIRDQLSELPVDRVTTGPIKKFKAGAVGVSTVKFPKVS